jgi:hypothetical protein
MGQSAGLEKLSSPPAGHTLSSTIDLLQIPARMEFRVSASEHVHDLINPWCCVAFSPALANILDMYRRTGFFYGVNEALFSSALAAIIFSVLGAQPCNHRGHHWFDLIVQLHHIQYNCDA